MTSLDGSKHSPNAITSSINHLNSSTIRNIYGSFLHYDSEKGGKILDLSKRVLRSPRNIIVGEVTERKGKGGRLTDAYISDM